MRKFITALTICVCFSGMALILVSCGGTRPPYVDDAREVKLPLSESEYKSDNEHYRVVSMGSSQDISLAEKIALQNAQSKLASIIQTTVTSVKDQYQKQLKDNSSVDYGQSFQAMEMAVSKETISNAKIKATKVLQRSDKTYDYWICLEVNKKELLENSLKKMSSSKIIQLETDRENFRKIFEQEIKKID